MYYYFVYNYVNFTVSPSPFWRENKGIPPVEVKHITWATIIMILFFLGVKYLISFYINFYGSNLQVFYPSCYANLNSIYYQCYTNVMLTFIIFLFLLLLFFLIFFGFLCLKKAQKNF